MKRKNVINSRMRNNITSDIFGRKGLLYFVSCSWRVNSTTKAYLDECFAIVHEFKPPIVPSSKKYDKLRSRVALHTGFHNVAISVIQGSVSNGVNIEK